MVLENERAKILSDLGFQVEILRSAKSVRSIFEEFSENGKRKMIHFTSHTTNPTDNPTKIAEFEILEKLNGAGIILPLYDVIWRNGVVVSSTNIRALLQKNR
ncbi:MAG: hypothetical protein ABIE03_06870 [Patescibacteria group bacterium]